MKDWYFRKKKIDTDYSDDKTANLMMLFERFARRKLPKNFIKISELLKISLQNMGKTV